MKTNRVKILCLIFCWFCSCSPTSLEDLRCEAESEVRKLVLELRKIENREELQKKFFILKKRFNKLADLLVETRCFAETSADPLPSSEILFIELARLYEIPGAREILEKTQREAIHRLNPKP